MKNLLSVAVLLPALFFGLAPERGQAQIGVAVSVNFAPPPLPVYEQPPCPVNGFLWTPGYWAWDADYGYYWVPGVWVAPPQPGLLWTPGYWGYENGVYGWNGGYWAPQVGYYGGVDYGWGYDGAGFVGGMWAGNVFRYNTAVMRVNTAVIHNVYVNRSAVRRAGGPRASFNGPGGVTARPTAREEQVMHERHFERTAAQTEHLTTARRDPQARFATNHGAPREAAMARVGERAVAATNRPSAGEIRAAQQQSHGAHSAATARRPGAEGRAAGGGARPATGHSAATRGHESRPGTTRSSQARPSGRPEKERAAAPARTQERAPARSTSSRTERAPAARTPTPHSESRPAPRTEARPESRPAPRTEARPESRPESRPAPRTEARPAARPAERPQARSAPRPEARPAPHPQARPEGHPAAHPEERPH